MTVSQATANRFAREESLRCDLLRNMARRASKSRDSSTSKDSSAEAAPGTCVDQSRETYEPPNSIPEELNRNVHQPVQPVSPAQVPDTPETETETESPWEYPDRAWRKHPLVMKYSGEVLVFIPKESYPAHADAAVPLIAWLRQPGRLSRPLTKSLHSGVIRVEGMGWIVTFGNIAGALDRMTLLLEWKAGQTLMFKGNRYTIQMQTSIPLEWIP
ncbi:hypothetical protein SLS55_009936 [Diplodia seriata]|uniref:Uncharacterized protein n=1 Tax=Diplodia seriata TaxID=420778 RepID=A0ABR3C290_9PEZI